MPEVLSVIVRTVWTSLPNSHAGAGGAQPTRDGSGSPAGSIVHDFATLRDALADPQRFLATAFRTRQCLLVLDHCDNVIAGRGDSGIGGFKYMLGQLLDDTKYLRILITASEHLRGVPGFGESVHKLSPLHVDDAAQLYARLCRHMGAGHPVRGSAGVPA